MGSNRRQQTINKRNRERAVAEKRALKIQRRQEKREAARNGEPFPAEGEATPSEGEPMLSEGEPTPSEGEPVASEDQHVASEAEPELG
jgi:hypothetical protein